MGNDQMAYTQANYDLQKNKCPITLMYKIKHIKHLTHKLE